MSSHPVRSARRTETARAGAPRRPRIAHPLPFPRPVAGSVAGFNEALSQIDVSVAYALWSALGTVLVATSGVLFFGEPCDAAKLACLALIVAGVVGLNVRDAPH